jgi:hypothetical protein
VPKLPVYSPPKTIQLGDVDWLARFDPGLACNPTVLGNEHSKALARFLAKTRA